MNEFGKRGGAVTTLFFTYTNSSAAADRTV